MGANILGAGALRALSALKRYRLPFAEVVEAQAGAGGLVKEVLAAVVCRRLAAPSPNIHMARTEQLAVRPLRRVRSTPGIHSNRGQGAGDAVPLENVRR